MQQNKDETLLFICAYCKKPSFIPVAENLSETLWRLRSCPLCRRQYGPAFSGKEFESRTVPNVIEWVVMEMTNRESTNKCEVGPDQALRGTSEHQEQLTNRVIPITSDRFKNKLIRRNGLPLDILTWIGAAAASGVLGGFAYDALKALLKYAMRQAWAPPLRATYLVKRGKGFDFGERRLSNEEVDLCIGKFFKYSKKRLALVQHTVEQNTPDPPPTPVTRIVEPLEVVYTQDPPSRRSKKKNKQTRRTQRHRQK